MSLTVIFRDPKDSFALGHLALTQTYPRYNFGVSQNTLALTTLIRRGTKLFCKDMKL